MSALFGEDDTKDQVERLTQILEKLEQKLAPESGMLSTVAAEPGGRSKLGPSVTARVYVNGHPTEALIDTGSPATVVSLEFVLDAFVKGRTGGQSPLEWKEETRKRFSLPSIALKAYSGHKLDIQYQVCVELTHGNRTIETVVLAQEGAPHDLLLGTDLQTKLGFALVAEDGSKLTDLLTGEEHSCWRGTTSGSCGDSPGQEPAVGSRRTGKTGDRKERPDQVHQSTTASTFPNSAEGTTEDVTLKPHRPNSAGGPTQDSNSQPPQGMPSGGLESVQPELTEGTPTDRAGVVRLLTAVKVPPGYMKTVKTQISGELDNSLLLFTPELGKQHLLLPDAALEGGDTSEATVVILNQGLEPIYMHKGAMLGTVVPVEEVTFGDRSDQKGERWFWERHSEV
jgi:hypothetical protein